jgi:uncharacterized cysteine cluster protein YcgN (CxxCxxCC family)
LLNSWINAVSDKPVNQPLRERFWEHYSLDQLTLAEWEAVCDGCGLCCLVKLEDEDTHEVAYTKLACKLLDCKTARCTDYANRKQHVPDCVQLTPDMVGQLHWLPPSCAYKRLDNGQKLPRWHPLITGNAKSVREARKSAAGRCIPETDIAEDDVEDYVVRWVR